MNTKQQFDERKPAEEILDRRIRAAFLRSDNKNETLDYLTEKLINIYLETSKIKTVILSELSEDELIELVKLPRNPLINYI